MSRKRLDSWKAIAEFLGRSLRTVQRWHDLNGLPVHRFSGQKGSVFAFEEEIDAWLAGLAEDAGTVRTSAEENTEPAKKNSRKLSASADRMWDVRSVKNIRTISHLYHNAIDHDWSNASALIGLANASLFGAMNDLTDAAIAVPIARGALRKLVPLNYDLLDSKCPSAWMGLLYDRELPRARKGFEEFLAKRPSSSFARLGLALSNLANGDLDEAIENAWEAWKLDPLTASLRGVLCWCIYLSGDFGRAFDMAGQLTGLDDIGISTKAIEALALAQDLPKNISRLEVEAQVHPHNDILQGVLGYSYGILGKQYQAREKFELLLLHTENGKTRNGYSRALAALGIGDERQAISWLEAASSQGSIWSLGLGMDPIVRSLRGNPDFERLIRPFGSQDQIVSDRLNLQQTIGPVQQTFDHMTPDRNYPV